MVTGDRGNNGGLGVSSGSPPLLSSDACLHTAGHSCTQAQRPSRDRQGSVPVHGIKGPAFPENTLDRSRAVSGPSLHGTPRTLVGSVYRRQARRVRGPCAVTAPVRLPRSRGPQKGFCLRGVWRREGPSARPLLVCVLPALSHSCPRPPRGEALPAPPHRPALADGRQPEPGEAVFPRRRCLERCVAGRVREQPFQEEDVRFPWARARAEPA